MMKRAWMGVILAGVLAGAGHAFMDGYQDRKGVYFGFDAAGGNGKAEANGGGDTSALGVMPSARLGIGSEGDLGVDLEGGVFFGSDDGVDQTHTGVYANVQKFLNKNIYVRGGLGFALGRWESTGVSETDNGLGFQAGFGVETFLSAENALRLGAVYRAHNYDDFDFTFMGLVAGLTFY